MNDAASGAEPAASSTRRVLLASMAGTTIEYFDFYIYATAAVLVFPRQFFPASSQAAATLQSLATFSIAFFTRPLGSAFFGHFGDRIGRKVTLVASLLTMGLSTVAIGLLPTYASIGLLAPVLLAMCRFGQGFGLGGEWGGAVLLATENAPPGKRAWYGMFPQLGAPVGFICCGVIYLALSRSLGNAKFLAYGWRIPFLASSVLVAVGLYVRLTIAETPVFKRAMEQRKPEAVPLLAVCRSHAAAVARGTMIALTIFVLFYILTVFCLSWGVTKLGYTRDEFLLFQMAGIVFFGMGIPWAAAVADRRGRRPILILATAATAVFGLGLGPLLGAGPYGALSAMILGFALIGVAYGPLSTVLSELFPTEVRYTGASLSFNLAGIFGGSLVPYLAVVLANHLGLRAIGYAVSASAIVTLLALCLSRETQSVAFAGAEQTSASL